MKKQFINIYLKEGVERVDEEGNFGQCPIFAPTLLSFLSKQHFADIEGTASVLGAMCYNRHTSTADKDKACLKFLQFTFSLQFDLHSQLICIWFDPKNFKVHSGWI